MDQKKDNDQFEHEIIDENDVIENLLNGEDKDGKGQFYSNQKNSQFVYTKQVGCFDFRSTLINLIIYTIVLMVTSGWFDGFYLGSLWDAFYAAVVMSLLNIVLKPILVILTLPLTILTFGLFYVFVNGFLLVVADYLMGSAFEITSFGVAVWASIFISVLRMAINHYFLKGETLKIKM